MSTNRRDRRRYKPRDPLSAKKILELQHRVEVTGQPGHVIGLTGACRDCDADANLLLLPGRQIIADIIHDPGCPAAAGVVPWAAHPLEDERD